MVDFSYKTNDTDKSLEFIRHKEQFFGYDEVNPTNFSKEINDLKEEIINDKEIMDEFEFSKVPRKSESIKTDDKIWNELGIKLQRVQFFKPSYKVEEMTFNGEITKNFYDKLEFDYPNKVKIIKPNNFLKTGFDALYIEFNNHNSIIYKYIALPEVDKMINNSVHAHEITHLEQENVGGGITTILNEETLPIFVELLFSTKTDESGMITDKIIKHRLGYLSGAINVLSRDKNMNFKTRIDLEKYIISIIQAIDLFNKYQNGSNKVKKELIGYINQIFEVEKVIEQVLDVYNSNFKEIEPKLKILKR